MGWFMNAFHTVGHGLTTVTDTVGGGLTKVGNYAASAAHAAYNAGSKVVRPVYQATKTATGAVFDHVVKPVANEGMKFANKGEAFAMANVDTVVNLQQRMAMAAGELGAFANNVEQGVSGFLQNSWSYVLIGGGVLAVALLLQR